MTERVDNILGTLRKSKPLAPSLSGRRGEIPENPAKNFSGRADDGDFFHSIGGADWLARKDFGKLSGDKSKIREFGILESG